MNKEELEVEIKLLQGTSPLKNEYDEALNKGKCECASPLLVFAGPGRGYCVKCGKVERE